MFLTASEMDQKPGKVQCSLLLHLMGEEAREICDNFQLSEEDKASLTVLIKQFDLYCEPRKNRDI